MGKKRIITIGEETDEKDEKKKEQKKLQKKREKEREKAESALVETKLGKKEKKEPEKEVKKEKVIENKQEEKKKEEKTEEVKPKEKAEKVEEKETEAKDKKEKLKKPEIKESDSASSFAKASEDKKATTGKEEKAKVKKPVQPGKGRKRSKRYKEMTKLIDKTKTYYLDEALKLVKETSNTKFDASCEVHIRLNIDSKKSEQNVRGHFNFPHDIGKSKKVLVFAEGEKEKEAKDAKADFVGADDLIKKIEKGFLGFDVVVATPDMMMKIAKLGKVLGTKGLMPTQKLGTVTNDIAKIVKELKAGRTEFKMDPDGIIHQMVGKVSMDEKNLKENVETLIKSVHTDKPTGAKGDLIRNIVITSSMGPGIKVTI